MSQRLSYPSYMDFDGLIDVERLCSLDRYIAQRLASRIAGEAADTAFYTGPFQLGSEHARVPGSRMVYLTRSVRSENYYDLNDPGAWKPSGEAAEFAPLMDFIATLPFKTTGRMLIIYDGKGRPVTAHRDHDTIELCHEFLWFRTNLHKPFYMLDPETSEKLYVRSHSAWFDTVNQYHGADGSEGLSFSVRVDGIFSDELRARIPFPEPNRAAAPSAWSQQQL
jgi:hypothetical protein